jgi:hypothetical protein
MYGSDTDTKTDTTKSVAADGEPQPPNYVMKTLGELLPMSFGPQDLIRPD